MGEKVMLPVVQDGEAEPREVETTATPGLYVAEHPDDEGWVLVAECGKYVVNITAFRWKTRADAQAAAAALGGTPIGWTLPEKELVAATPHAVSLIVEALKPLEDRRHPYEQRQPAPSTKHRPSQARKTAAELLEGPGTQ